MIRSILTLFFITLLSSCVGPAKYSDSPNLIQRAEVLSENKSGITIQHSKWGNKIAFRLADEHCNTLNATAAFSGSYQQLGPDIISSWKCE